MNKWTIVAIVVLAVIILASIFFAATPTGRSIWNRWTHNVQVADDATNYETIKRVEDTCRSMIASYYADKLTYEQYKDSDDKEKQEWAEEARMRANKTASTYNNYILRNKYVWKNDIPSDIKYELDTI